MTLEQLSQRNEKFQRHAMEITELLPGSNLLAFSSRLIRSARKLEDLLRKVLAARSEMAFYNQVETMEEEMDEIIYLLDKLDDANRKRKIGLITDLVKGGYELISVYSLCNDQLLEKRIKNQDEFE